MGFYKRLHAFKAKPKPRTPAHCPPAGRRPGPRFESRLRHQVSEPHRDIPSPWPGLTSAPLAGCCRHWPRLQLSATSSPAAPHASGSRTAAQRPPPLAPSLPASPGLPRAAPHPRVISVAVKAPRSAPSPERWGGQNNKRCPEHDSAHSPTPLRGAEESRRDCGARAERAAPTNTERLCPPPGPGRSVPAWGCPCGRLRARSAGGGSQWETPVGRKENTITARRTAGTGSRGAAPHLLREEAAAGPRCAPSPHGRPQPAGCAGRPAATEPHRSPAAARAPAATHLRGAGTRRSCPRPPPCLLRAERLLRPADPRLWAGESATSPPPPPAAAGSAWEQVRAGPALTSPVGVVGAAPHRREPPLPPRRF